MTDERREHIRNLLGMEADDPSLAAAVIFCEARGEPVSDEAILQLPGIMSDLIGAMDECGILAPDAAKLFSESL